MKKFKPTYPKLIGKYVGFSVASYNDPVFFDVAGQIGRDLGLEWGGDFKSIKDRPHFQLMFGYSCSSYLAGTKIPDTVKFGCLDKHIVKFIQNLVGIDADGIFGSKTKEAVAKYNPSGEVDAATLSKLITATSSSKLKISVNGSTKEIMANLLNNSWQTSLDTISKLIPNDTVNVRTILEAAGYTVSWTGTSVLAKK